MADQKLKQQNFVRGIDNDDIKLIEDIIKCGICYESLTIERNPVECN